MNETENKYMTKAEEAAKALPSIEQTVETDHQIRISRADEVAPEEVQFLWKPYLLRGDVNILAAAGGTGKTFAICGIIAELSNGRLPLNPFERISPVRTLFISAEDQAFIIRDRLEKAGANLAKVFVVDAMESVNLTLSDGRGKPDVSQLEALIVQAGVPDLVVIDPLHAVIGSEVKMTEQNVDDFLLASFVERYSDMLLLFRAAFSMSSFVTSAYSVHESLPSSSISNAMLCPAAA